MSPESPTLDRQEEAERANKQPTQPIPVLDRLDLIKVGTRGDEALGLVIQLDANTGASRDIVARQQPSLTACSRIPISSNFLA